MKDLARCQHVSYSIVNLGSGLKGSVNIKFRIFLSGFNKFVLNNVEVENHLYSTERAVLPYFKTFNSVEGNPYYCMEDKIDFWRGSCSEIYDCAFKRGSGVRCSEIKSIGNCSKALYLLGNGDNAMGSYADLQINLKDKKNVILKFDYASQNYINEKQNEIATGVYISDDDGVTFVKLTDLPKRYVKDNACKLVDLAISSLATTKGFKLNEKNVFRFKLIAQAGYWVDMAIDNIEIFSVPSAPINLQAKDVKSSSVKLLWSPPNGNLNIDHYFVSNETVVYKVYDTEFDFNGLKPGSNYSFKVKAVDVYGKKSDWSEELMIITKQNQPLSQPQNLEAGDITSSSIKLLWSASYGDSEIEYYLVSYDDTTVQVSKTEHTIKNLKSANVYVFKVQAVDVNGNKSDWSEDLTVTTAEACLDKMVIVDLLAKSTERKASEVIIASNTISGSGVHVHYGAGEKVCLIEGFKVVEGATFLADLNGCKNDLKSFKNEEFTDIQDKQNYIYPNPVKERLTIELAGDVEIKKRVMVFGVDGEIKYSGVHEGNMFDIDFSNFKAGVYIVKVLQQRKEVLVKKIIKK